MPDSAADGDAAGESSTGGTATGRSAADGGAAGTLRLLAALAPESPSRSSSLFDLVARLDGDDPDAVRPWRATVVRLTAWLSTATIETVVGHRPITDLLDGPAVLPGVLGLLQPANGGLHTLGYDGRRRLLAVLDELDRLRERLVDGGGDGRGVASDLAAVRDALAARLRSAHDGAAVTVAACAAQRRMDQLDADQLLDAAYVLLTDFDVPGESPRARSTLCDTTEEAVAVLGARARSGEVPATMAGRLRTMASELEARIEPIRAALHRETVERYRRAAGHDPRAPETII